MNTLHANAVALTDAGMSVVPVRNDGSKAPTVRWADRQDRLAEHAELDRWFADQAYDGLGVLTGTPSGNLEMLEVEGRATDLIVEVAGLMAANGFTELWTRIASGWVEMSPSGGVHWHYRVDGPARPNTKLARRPNAENSKLVDVLIETRGEGGFTVTAPSAGRAHPTGKAWTLIAGAPAEVPTITVDERDALHHICSLLDQMPVIDQPAPPTAGAFGSTPAVGIQGLRPGDDFNARATWDDVLTPHGWTRTRHFGGNAYGWTRPEKKARDGISATTGRNDGDNLFVFSSSTAFETEKAYSKFAAYTLLEHHGSYADAARALRTAGYGSEPHVTAPAPSSPAPASAPVAMSGVHGNLATVTTLPVERPALQVVPGQTLAHSDDANALLLVDRYGDVLRHCADRNRWYAWDGTVWYPCPRTAGPAREYAKLIARSLPERNEKDISFKKKSLSAIGISAMLTQAASDERVAVEYSELDSHPWELNTPGGIVDLRTGQLRPADPGQLHTRLTSATPDPAADRTAWLRFLDVTFGGDAELIGFMQRMVGYSAVGLVGAHVLPYCFGSGGNGKGVFLETCVRVLRDYATTAPAGFLMAKTYQGHETELARLSGARMVLCSEVNDDDRFDEARVKGLTGGDSITARFMQQDHFTFSPTHQLWAMGNHQPHVRAGGPSFWRRLRLIPFQHEVKPEDVIDDLQGILANEHGPSVLAWIVEGAAAYHQAGLAEPASVKAATGAYERDQDTVTRFLEEMCQIGGAGYVETKVTIVRAAYEAWCRESGDQPVTAKAFGTAMARHGIATTRTSTARLYSGIALLSEPSEADAR